MNAKISSALLLGIFLQGVILHAQNFTSYFTGDTSDVVTDPVFGIALAGGGGDNDDAMAWFLERADGGDVLVLRASGADGYNDYFYSQLGVSLNSVETIVCNNAEASNEPYVINRIQEAEAIFIAGGDQWDYVSYWKDTPVEDALNDHMLVKQGPIGGTSAGMAILGGHYFSAENGTVYSEEALEDPFNTYMTIGHHDFLQTPFLHDVITDTHYDDPDRRARHMTFLARIYADGYEQALGIGCEEFTCVCVDENGVAWIYGEYPEFEDYAYFLRHGCEDPWTPENCSDGEALTWDRNDIGLYVLKSPGTPQGINVFLLTDWITWNGGGWQEWWVEDGVFNANEVSFGPECFLDVVTLQEELQKQHEVIAFPNPATDEVIISSRAPSSQITVYDLTGQLLLRVSGNQRIQVDQLPSGLYPFVVKYEDGSYSTGSFIVEQ